MSDIPAGGVSPHPLHGPVAEIAGVINDDCERHHHEVPSRDAGDS